MKRASIRATKMRFPSFLLACSVACSFACSKDRDYTGGSDSTGGLGGAAGEAGSSNGGSSNGGDGTGGSGDGGNATGGQSSVTPTIQTEDLSAAQLNQPYSASLEAEGGSGDLTFELTEGTLPPGLTLDENGKLHGTPRITGTFTFTVRVTDEKEKTATAELTLVVAQKDWLVYRSDKAERFLTRLYAVQLSSALMPVTEIAGGALPATARVHSMLFSPDGKTLAFVADTLTAGEYDVYLVDMSTKVPGKPRALGFALSGTGTLSWSPNGKRLACSSSDVKVIDLSEDTPEPKSLGAGYRGYWVSNTQIAFVRYATPDVNLMRADWPVGDEPGTPQSLPISAFCFGATCSEYFQAHPDMNIYEYGAMDPSGGMTTRNVLFSATDTAWSTSYENGRPVSPLSRDFKLGVKYDTGNALGIVELPSQEATKSLADVGTLSRWANTSHDLLVSSTSGKFQLVDADAETLTAVDIPGTYGTPDGDHCKHRFSPDDSWVALFDEDANTYVSKLGSQTPGETQLVGTLAARGTFSPDSRFYAFAGDPTNTGAIDLSLVDLSSGTATAPVRQNERGTNETERDVQVSYAGPCSGHDSRMADTFFFSPNSSHLVHMVRQGYGSAYLYVTALLDATTGDLAEGRTGVNRTGSITCTNECTDGTCTSSCGTTEMDFVFQP